MKKEKIAKDIEIKFELSAEEVQACVLKAAGFKGESRDGSRKANELIGFELTKDGGAVGSYR